MTTTQSQQKTREVMEKRLLMKYREQINSIRTYKLRDKDKGKKFKTAVAARLEIDKVKDME